MCYRLLATLAVCLCATPAVAQKSLKITHGPILGRLGPDHIGVWARTSDTGSFRVRYGTSADKLDRTSPEVLTLLHRDNTGWVLLEGLQPDTKYFYQVFTSDQDDGPRGSFRTLPDGKDFFDPKLNPKGLFNFRFEFACGNNQTPGQGAGPALPAFRTLNDQFKDKLNFAVLNGDWLYEDRRDYAPAEWLTQVGRQADDTPKVVNIAPTIVGVWENYKTYLSRGKNLSEWHRQMPTFFTFDDHEILNDVWGAGTPGLRDRRAVFRDIGVQAWYDYLGWSNPVEHKQGIHFGRADLKAAGDVLTDPSAEFTKLDRNQAGTLHVHWGEKDAGVNENELDGVRGEQNAGVYEIVEVLDDHHLRIRPAAQETKQVSYSIGRRSYYRKRIANCDFFFCDTRSHRQMHDTRRPSQPGLSMLGVQQRDWLLSGMRRSDADFLFVFSSVNFMVPHVGGGKVRGSNKDDAWTVFFDEREKLIDAFDKLGKPVFICTGDLHNSFVIKITDRVWEFASGPHNSNNHWSSDEGNRPATGIFKYGPRACLIRWSTSFRSDIPRENLTHPHFCVVQLNNVYNNPIEVDGQPRWVAFERPQVVFQYYNARTGELQYAEAISSR